MARWQPKAPVKIGDVFQGLKEVREEAGESVKILVAAGQEKEAKELIGFLISHPGEAKLFNFLRLTEKIPTEVMEKVSKATCTLIFLKNESLLEQQNLFLITTLSEQKRPFLVVLEGVKSSQKEVVLEKAKRVFQLPSSKAVFVTTDQNQGLTGLIRGILRQASGREVALAKNLTLFKEEAANIVVKKTGLQNALISSMIFISGPDMPILTLNQIKMVLKIAAIYNDELDLTRARELLAVLGGGFTFRGLARRLLGMLPTLGVFIRGAVAYTGTEAIGQAAIKYFEYGLNEVAFSDFR